MKQPIYLDYAAATPLDDDVFEDMKPYFSQRFYNPSSIYLASRGVKGDLNKARQKVAGILGAKPSEIIFTAGGTEANNLALFGVMQNFPGGHIVASALEHDSVLKPLEILKKRGQRISEVIPQKDGVLDPSSVAKAVNDNTVLVSIMYANNEIGTIQPIKQIASRLAEIRTDRQKRNIKTPLYFHTDACQAANYLDLHVHRLGVDLMTINGGKIYGPKQSGVLFSGAFVALEPIIFGGGQESNRRSGTENIGGSIGLASALEKAQAMKNSESARLRKLQKVFMEELAKKIPTSVINGSLKHRLPNNLHITVPGSDNERLLFGLDEMGVQAAAGAACSASKEESSHVLRALGKSDEYARSSLRFSMGRFTTEADVKKVISLLTDLI